MFINFNNNNNCNNNCNNNNNNNYSLLKLKRCNFHLSKIEKSLY